MIPLDYVDKTCKLGHGEACCAFLMMGATGFECAKGTEVGGTIRRRLAEGSMNAKGDNCAGWGTVVDLAKTDEFAIEEARRSDARPN